MVRFVPHDFKGAEQLLQQDDPRQSVGKGQR